MTQYFFFSIENSLGINIILIQIDSRLTDPDFDEIQY